MEAEDNGTSMDVEFGKKESASLELGKGFNALIQPGALTIFGEIHGTREVPRLISDLVKNADKAPVVVGLEAFESLTPLLKTYIQSKGTDDDIADLLKHPFWKTKDGRSSQALFKLLGDLRELRKAGKNIDVFAFDAESRKEKSRDEDMAQIVIEKLKNVELDRTITLIVTGNLHARIDSERWMAWHIRKAFPRTLSLNNAYSGGTAWICTNNGCGPTTLHGIDRGKKQFVERSGSARWEGIFYLGSISASRPISAASQMR